MTAVLEHPALDAEPALEAGTGVEAGAVAAAFTAAVSAPLPLRPLPTLSCVVPCRDEAANLARLVPRLAQVLAGCTRAFEIIVVDDGSRDGTALQLEREHRAELVVLQLSRNFGKEAALTAGLEAARGEVVVMIDADLQHPPELIARFVRHWRAGADMVYAQRLDRSAESRFKRWGTRWFYRMMRGTGRFEVPADAGDFRLLGRTAVDALLALPERNRFMKGLYAWVGFDAVAVPYTPAERLAGRSRFGTLRLVGLALDGLTAFTTWPLRAASVVGLVLSLLAFGYGGYLTVSYFIQGHEVSGWTTIVVSLMLFSGLQLMSLGVLGEYLGRVFEEVKRRPLYVVKRRQGRGLGTAAGTDA
ncbi:MAG: glycosyltransferase family 2 protein [Rubrivivax sp.]